MRGYYEADNWEYHWPKPFWAAPVSPPSAFVRVASRVRLAPPLLRKQPRKVTPTFRLEVITWHEDDGFGMAEEVFLSL